MIQLWDVGTGQPIGEPIRASSRLDRPAES